MAYRIQQGLAKRSFRHKVPLDPLYPLIGYLCPHILQINQLDCLVHLLQKGSMNFILVKKIGIRLKIADLQESPELIPFRIFAEKKHRGIGQIISIE